MPFDHLSSCAGTQPLTASAVGARVRISGVGGAAGLERRLTELGLPRGAEAMVVGRMGRNGAMIVAAHGVRLVVGADMAASIMVTPLDG